MAGRAGAHRHEAGPATRDRYGAAVSSFPRHYQPTSPPLTWQPMTVRSYHTAFRRRIDRAIIGMEAFRDRRSASGLHLFSLMDCPARPRGFADRSGSTQVRWALEYYTLSIVCHVVAEMVAAILSPPSHQLFVSELSAADWHPSAHTASSPASADGLLGSVGNRQS